MSAWKAALAPDGRTYFYHQGTNKTTWEQPDDFDGELPEPATLAELPPDWAEAKHNGRSYWYNKATQETTWKRPAPPEQQLSQPPRNARSDFEAGSGGGYGTRDDFGGRPSRRDERDHGLPQKPTFDGPRGGGGAAPWDSRHESTGFRGPMPVKTDEPEYGTTEAAEEAFFKLLKRHNITPDSEWQDAVRAVITERDFRAIKDPRERQVAFEKYRVEVRAQEKIKEKERKEKVREEFRRMLSTHDEIEHYTRWKTARPYLEREAVFKSAGDDHERRRIFDEYILELKKKHAEDEVNNRRTAMQELDNMLKVLILDPDTRWADAEETITNNERFVSEEIFKDVRKADVFLAYESHMKALERIANEVIQRKKQNKYRRQRQARDVFKQLLSEEQEEGKIKAGAKWQDLFPVIKDDERFTSYLGIQGSDPLDLFRDLVEDEERKLRSKRNDVYDVLEEKRYEVTLETPLEDFAKVMQSHPKTAVLADDEIGLLFERILDKLRRRAEESKLDAERQQKAVVDSIRSAMKRASPPIRADDTYEEVASRLTGHRDFDSVDEDVRRKAFDKYMLRLKERESHDRDRDRRVDRDRERSRERDRDRRNGSRLDDRDRDRRHRTRTPEVDAYEADRRKAQAERERQYKRASFGLTPPPRDRREDRYDDRREERTRRPDPRDGYERDRREREVERERMYLSRADPRDKGKTLDYGDEDQVGSRPPSIRKRRDSDGSAASRRDVKRPRREAGRTRSPEPSLPKEDEPALQSGSEEGEIEEV